MFIVALFTMVPNEKQSKYSSLRNGLKYIYMVSPYNGIIFSNKKVYHKSVTLNESQTQDQTLYGYVYMKFTGKRNPETKGSQ